MEKNVTVLSSEGEMIGVTYPKRALGLVKKGRARYLDGDETVIVLASSPVDITSQEDDMNNNFNFDEFIVKAKATAKVASEEVSELADKSAKKIDDVFAKLNDAFRDYAAKINEAAEAVKAEEAGSDAESEEAVEPFEEVIEDVLGDINDEEVRAKIRAEVEREKARRERAKERAQRKAEVERKMSEVAKEAAKTVAVAARDAAAWTKQTIKNAEAKLAEAKEKAKEAELISKEKVAEAKERIAAATAAAKAESEPAPELTVEGMLYEIRRIERDNEHIISALDSVLSIQSDGPGDIGAQAKASAIETIVKCRETTNQKLLDTYSAMLQELTHEEILRKAEEEELLEAHRKKKNDARLSVFEDLLDSIRNTDVVSDKDRLAFYMKTAKKLAENSNVITPEMVSRILEVIAELDPVKDREKFAFFMSLIG